MARKKSNLSREEYTILIVDDQIDVLDSVEPLLRREGYNVLRSQGGREAIEILKNEKVDLLLLDYFMPGITGEEVVREVRIFDRELFILLQTGYAGQKPPLEMLKELDIQGYHDKTEGPDKLMLWVAAGIRSCSQMRVNKQMREGLTCILESVPHIFRIQAFNDLLNDILEHLKGLVKFENGFIMLEDYGEEGTLFSGQGRFNDILFSQLHNISLREDLIQEAKQRQEVVRQESILVLPVRNEENIMGYIYIEDCKLENDEALYLIKIYVNQTVEAIINMQLHQVVLMTNEKLNNSYLELNKTYFELIESFTKAVDAKDRYTAGHSTRVSLYARIIGRAMGMSREELTKLKVAALFHDIGKIGVRDAVLTKEGRLTDDEFKDIKSHTTVGCDILSPVTLLQKIIPGIKHHHEKYDGRGYPDGLAGEEIPLLARILTVADSFDAMTSNRSYQRKRSFDDALLEVERCAGTQFDPAIASCFIQEVKKHYKNIERMIDFWNHIHKFGKEYELDETAEQLAAATTEE